MAQAKDGSESSRSGHRWGGRAREALPRRALRFLLACGTDGPITKGRACGQKARGASGGCSQWVALENPGDAKGPLRRFDGD